MFDEMAHKTVLLDNGKSYQVIWVIELDGHKYLCLLNPDDIADLLICERISGECLEEITDMALADRIILQVTNQICTFVLF